MATPDQPDRMASRVAIPYGGDAAVARSMLAVHVRNPWTGRCRGCGDMHPCADRQAAESVLGPPARGAGGTLLAGLAIAAGLVVSVAAAAVLVAAGLMRW